MKNIPIYAIEQFKGTSTSKHFYGNSFKKHLEKHRFIDKPHRHSFYLIVVITAGSGTHTIDFVSYPMQKGSVFMLQPGQMHHWELSKDIQGYIIFHSKEIYDIHFRNQKIKQYPFYYSTYNSPYLQVSDNTLKAIWHWIGMIDTFLDKKRMFYQQRLLALVDLVYMEIAGEYVQNTFQKVPIYNKRFQVLEQYIDQYYTTQKAPAFYADKMNLSLKHTNRICKEIAAKTLTQVITDRVVLQAKRLLLKPNRSVTELAYELGYTDYSYFSRMFKAKTGYTPIQFRKNSKFKKSAF